MERKNTGQLLLACTGHLRDNRQPRRLGSVLPLPNAITAEIQVKFPSAIVLDLQSSVETAYLAMS